MKESQPLTDLQGAFFVEDATFTYVQSTTIGSRTWRDIIVFSHHGLCCRDEARENLPRFGSI